MELLDIVDHEDRVIGVANRDDIYLNKHKHRIVHILVFNKKGDMALQLRSKKVSFCPQYWCTAAGGHVQSEERYEEAALREYEEELGVRSELTHFSKDSYQSNKLHDKFLSIYTTVHEGPFAVDVEEVERIDFYSIDKIREMITKGEKFHPELIFILNKYYL